MRSRYPARKQRLVKELHAIEREHQRLRADMRSLRHAEASLYGRLERALRAANASHLMVVDHRPGKKDRIRRFPLDGSRMLTALALRNRSSGLFCGCRLILIAPQPDGSVDACVLVGCSNDPEKTGFRCEYWCFTIRQPVVAALSKRPTTRRPQHILHS